MSVQHIYQYSKFAYKIKWTATLDCNYKCEYCYQRELRQKSENHPTQERLEFAANQISKMIYFINVKDVDFIVVGGEMTLFDCKRILKPLVDNQLVGRVTFTTNLSNTVEYYNDLCAFLGPKLKLKASFHNSQVDIDSFIEKAKKIKELKSVNAVLTEDNISNLIKLSKNLKHTKILNCFDYKTHRAILIKNKKYKESLILFRRLNNQDAERRLHIEVKEDSGLVRKTDIHGFRMHYADEVLKDMYCTSSGININPDGLVTHGQCRAWLNRPLGNIYEDYHFSLSTKPIICESGDKCRLELVRSVSKMEETVGDLSISESKDAEKWW